VKFLTDADGPDGPDGGDGATTCTKCLGNLRVGNRVYLLGIQIYIYIYMYIYIECIYRWIDR